MSRKILNGILDNFLGTYTSRYSDYKGYWLFGMLIAELGDLKIDLLSSMDGENETLPIATAKRLAKQKFHEQMDKADLDISCIQEAHVEIIKLSDSKKGAVNGRICEGSAVRFVATAVVDSGRTYKRETSIFVALHDPKVEHRRAVNDSSKADPSTSSG